MYALKTIRKAHILSYNGQVRSRLIALDCTGLHLVVQLPTPLAHNGAHVRCEWLAQVRCEWLSREREIMSELSRESHPFIVRLYATYADETHVYLQLGAAMGGDMYWLLSRLESMRKTRYDLVEIIGRFYAASLSLALQHIHEHDVVYRDLKPENVIALDDLMIASLIYRDLKPENAIHGTEHGLGLRL